LRAVFKFRMMNIEVKTNIKFDLEERLIDFLVLVLTECNELIAIFNKSLATARSNPKP
jgi:hypothetical protein